jgi:hypothetical protein
VVANSKGEELWLPVKDYEEVYLISNMGKVKNSKTSRVLKLKENIDGYYVVCLSEENKKKEFRVSRLVAQAFLPNPQGLPVVNHIDGNKKNNWVDNLEWTTISYNTQHAYNLGLNKPWLSGVVGEDHPFAKDYIFISPINKEILVRGFNNFCKENGLSVRNMFRVLSGEQKHHKNWRVTKNEIS